MLGSHFRCAMAFRDRTRATIFQHGHRCLLPLHELMSLLMPCRAQVCDPVDKAGRLHSVVDDLASASEPSSLCALRPREVATVCCCLLSGSRSARSARKRACCGPARPAQWLATALLRPGWTSRARARALCHIGGPYGTSV